MGLLCASGMSVFCVYFVYVYAAVQYIGYSFLCFSTLCTLMRIALRVLLCAEDIIIPLCTTSICVLYIYSSYYCMFILRAILGTLTFSAV